MSTTPPGRDGDPERVGDLPEDTQLASVQGGICTKDSQAAIWPSFTCPLLHPPPPGFSPGQVLEAKVSLRPATYSSGLYIGDLWEDLTFARLRA